MKDTEKKTKKSKISVGLDPLVSVPRYFLQKIGKLSAWGGGMDGPESVACAFDAAVELGFRELAAKVITLSEILSSSLQSSSTLNCHSCCASNN